MIEVLKFEITFVNLFPAFLISCSILATGGLFSFIPYVIYKSFFLKKLSINKNELYIETVFKTTHVENPNISVIFNHRDLYRFNYFLYIKKFGLLYISSEYKHEIPQFLEAAKKYRTAPQKKNK